MKKQILILTIAATALASCGGGNTTQNQGSTADSVANVAASTDINKQIWDLIIKDIKFEVDLNDNHFEDNKTSDGVDIKYEGTEMSNYFAYKYFPLKSGGAKVYSYITDFFPTDGSKNRFEFKAYIFKDGKLQATALEPDLQKQIENSTDLEDRRNLFTDKGIKFATSDVTFNWDGESMQKQQPELFACEILKQIFKDPEEYERVANEIQEKYAEDASTEEWGLKEHLTFTAQPDDMYPEEGYLDCFPIKTGGYFVLYSTMSCGDYEHWTYYPYVYKNGTLSDGKSLMPHPEINDFYSNADKFPKEAAEVLKLAVQNQEYSFNNDKGKITLTVSFTAMELDERGGVFPKPLKGFNRKQGLLFPDIQYHWDGEQFARNDNSKPYKENLQYFELIPEKWKSTLAYKVAQKLNLEYDNEASENNYFYKYWNDQMDAPRYCVMCFPRKDGSYLVLTGYNEISLREYKTYIYNNGELSETDFKLPTCELSEVLDEQKCQGLEQEIAALEEAYKKTPQFITAYNINPAPEQQTVSITFSMTWEADIPSEMRQKLWGIGDWQTNPKYKWDGENFVKQ